MKIQNEIKKGTVLKVEYGADEKIYLLGNENRLDISDKLTSEERAAVKHLNGARAVVTSNEEISLVLYVQYHVHSEYSILDGMSKLTGIAKKSSGVTAITDHGNMHCLLKWQSAMKKVGKKAIFGCEVYVENYIKPAKTKVSKTNNDEESISRKEYKNGCHLVLLAKNDIGRINIFTLSSNAYDNFYRKPHVTIEDLKKYSDGLICTSACLGGELARVALEDGFEKAKDVALFYKNIFGDDYYIELQRHNLKEEMIVNPILIKVARELNIKLLAANDSHYLEKEDSNIHEALLCINQKKTLREEHWSFNGDGYYFKTDMEMINEWHDLPEAIANSFEIADKCNVEIETGVYHLPKYPVPEGYTEESYLNELIENGFRKRYENTDKFNSNIYRERLEYEKNVIFSMGYAAYFLIVWDYVSWAKNNGIMVGPGRGSAAGSLVAYCLTITDLDPIDYDLLFERFLNPDRVSMPDIDMDFEDSRRQEVIDYVRAKYGSDAVCGIITFGRLMPKVALNDIGRVTGQSDVSIKLSKLIPDEPKITLDKSVDEVEELRTLLKTDERAKSIFEVSKKIEGNTRQIGMHACGIVVADRAISNYMPTALLNTKDEKKLICQVTEVEDMGLLKMDFLGLKTMSIIGDTLKLINKERKENKLSEISNYRDIPLNDPYVYKVISEGTSYAVFQIESAGMRNFMSELYADVKDKIAVIEEKYGFTGFGENIVGSGTDRLSYEKEMQQFGDELFDRMIAGVSLYRPGPMDYIPDYIKGINDPSTITYDTPQLEPILKSTYGVIVYQEQVMQIVRALAGFSMSAADSTRKAMGKKKQEILDELKPFFISGSGNAVDEHTGKAYNINGCIANGINEETANMIWNKMSEFAKYAFNKSHAAVYAVLTVTCAWMKFYYPTYYMCSVLNTYIDGDKLKGYINVTKELGITILPPNINKSYALFTVEDNAIRFGLKGIKGLSKTVYAITDVREDSGLYTDLYDFIFRTIEHKIDKSVVESLIYAGAFDDFGYTRASLICRCPFFFQQAKLELKDKYCGQITLFDLDTNCFSSRIEIPYVAEFNKLEMLNKEKEYAGLFISEHPLDSFQSTLTRFQVTDSSLLFDDDGNVIVGKTNMAGCIEDIKVITTKKGEKMVKFVLEDRSGKINCIVFPSDYDKLRSLILNNATVIVKGVVETSNYGTQLIVNNMINVEQAATSSVQSVYVKINSVEEMDELKAIIKVFAGNADVYAQFNNTLFKLNYKANASASLYMTLQNKFGTEYVLYK